MKTIEEIRKMTEAAELDKVIEEVRSRMSDSDADIKELNDIVDAVEARKAELRAAEEARQSLNRKIAGGEAGKVVRTMGTKEEKTVYNDASKEYRSAFLKAMLDQEMTKEERDAYTAVTTDVTHGAANVLPRQMLNTVWDLIDEQHAILGDITMYRTGTILEVAKRTAISQGDAANVNEAAANNDEINEFVKVTLSGKDFSKHVDISYAMAQMSIDAFESFLTQEIAARLGAALAAETINQIVTDYDSTNNLVTTTTAKKLVFSEVAEAMGTLKNAMGQCVVYGTRQTIFNYLVGMVDDAKRPIFQVNANEGVEGYLIGCPVKVDDSVPANALLIGYPKQVVGNMVQDIMVESDKDIKKHVITYAGYARYECKLLAPKAFARISVKQS